MQPEINPRTLAAHHTCEHLPTMNRNNDPQAALPSTDFATAAAHHAASTRQVVLDALTGAGDLSVYPAGQRTALTLDAIHRRRTHIRGGRLQCGRYVAEPDLLCYQQDAYVPVLTTTASRAPDVPGQSPERPSRRHASQLALTAYVLQALGLPAAPYGYVADAGAALTRCEFHEPYGKRIVRTPWQDFEDDLKALESILDGATPSKPALQNACTDCRWRRRCLQDLEDADDLTLIPDLGPARRSVLAPVFPTRADLARSDPETYVNGNKTAFKGIGPDTLRRLHARAVLALQPDPRPRLLQQPVWPDTPLDVYLALQADPFADAHYLHAFLLVDRKTGESTFHAFLAEPPFDRDSETQAFVDALTWLEALPSPVTLYHFSPYERTAWNKLVTRHHGPGTAARVARLFDPAAAVDLFKVARDCADWPGYDLTLKTLATICGGEPDADLQGYTSVLAAYRDWAEHDRPQPRQVILEAARHHTDSLLALRTALDTFDHQLQHHGRQATGN